MRQIVKGSTVLTLVSIGEMFMRFVRTKLIAMMLGPSGTGFLAQLAIFFEALRIWGDLGSRRAVIKQVAEQRFSGEASDKYREVIKTSFYLVTAASLIVGSLVAVFSREFSQILYGTPAHYPFIIFLGLSLPIASISTMVTSVVKGNLNYAAYAKYTLWAYLGVILVAPVLVYFYRAWGGILVQTLFFLFPLGAYLLWNRKAPFLFFSKKINPGLLKEQFSFGFLQIYQDTLTNLTRMAVAVWIVRTLGLAEMGIYQVVITFTTVYMAVPIQAMSGYTFPVIAASETQEEISRAVNDSFRFLTFMIAPVIFGLMIFPEPLIVFFYSRAFLDAAPVLQIQLFSTLFILMSYSYMAALTAKSKFKSVYTIATCSPLIFVCFAPLLFHEWGLEGTALAFSISALASYVLQVWFCRRYFGISLMPKNQRLAWMTYVWSLLIFFVMRSNDGAAARFWLVAFGAVWFLVSSKDHERKYLWDKAVTLFRRKNLAHEKI